MFEFRYLYFYIWFLLLFSLELPCYTMWNNVRRCIDGRTKTSQHCTCYQSKFLNRFWYLLWKRFSFWWIQGAVLRFESPDIVVIIFGWVRKVNLKYFLNNIFGIISFNYHDYIAKYMSILSLLDTWHHRSINKITHRVHTCPWKLLEIYILFQGSGSLWKLLYFSKVLENYLK